MAPKFKTLIIFTIPKLVAAGSLFLVGGEATPKSPGKAPVKLYRFVSGQGLLTVRHVSDGADFIRQSLVSRMLVVGPHSNDAIPSTLEMVDFDDPEKKVEFVVPSIHRGGAHCGSHFLQVPGVGGVYALDGCSTSPAGIPQSHFFGVRLHELGDERQTRWEAVPPSWVAYAEMTGFSGPPGTWNADFDYVRGSPGGIPRIQMGLHGAELKWPAIPIEMRAEDITTVIWGMNRDVLVLGVMDATSVLVCDSKSKTWRKIGEPGLRKRQKVKVLDEWISLIPWERVPEEEVRASRRLLIEQNKAALERRKTDPNAQPDFTGIDLADQRRTGGTYLYNALTQQMFLLAKGKEDVELLLVEAGNVYYRNADQLVRAKILADHLDAPEILIKHEAMRGVHWAFMSSGR